MISRYKLAVEDDTYIFLAAEVDNLIKRLPAVVLADGITLLVAHMVICGDEDSNRVCLCKYLLADL